MPPPHPRPAPSTERVQTGDENNIIIYILFGLGLICLSGYTIKQKEQI